MNKAAGLFSAFTRNFAYGLKAYVDQRVEGGETLEAEPTSADSESDAERAPAEAESADAASDAVEQTEATTDAERASADGVPPDAASDAEQQES
jgi:hypothetical protein